MIRGCGDTKDAKTNKVGSWQDQNTLARSKSNRALSKNGVNWY